MSFESDTAFTANPQHTAGGLGVFRRLSRRNFILGLAIMAVVLALYDPVKAFLLTNYDDPAYINLRVKQGLTWNNIVWSFTAFDVSNWHPLTWISYFFDSTLFRASAAGFHYVNVLLHALNAALLFFMLNSATRRIWPSFFVAGLFAVHPFNVQSVAWVAERKNVLCTLFFLLALLAYRRYALQPGTRRYLLVLVCFALGLMAKPMVITLPGVLLLWDFWPLQRVAIAGLEVPAHRTEIPARSWRLLLIEKIPLFALSAASAWVTIAAQQQGGAVRGTESFTVPIRLKSAALSYATYLYKAFWPTRFSAFYSQFYFQRHSHPHLQLYLAVFLLLLISVLVAMRRRKQPYLVVGWLWYVGTLVPVIGVLQIGDQGIADRYAYIPLMGIFLAVVWAAAEWACRLPSPTYFAALAGSLLLLILFADSRAQMPVWKNSVALWSHAVQVDDSDYAEFMLGSALESEGRAMDGLSRFALVVARDPGLPLAHFNYATSLLRNHQPQKAVSELQSALRSWDADPGATSIAMRSHYHLGVAYLQLGNQKAAEEQFEQTIRMDPSHYESYLQLGLLYQQQDRCADAMMPLAISLRMHPSNTGLVSFGICLERQGKLREARAALQEALRISPDDEPAQIRLNEIEHTLAGNKDP